MEINIICVGKIKEKYISDGINEYAKRIKAYGDLNIIELKEIGNDKERLIAINLESESILETINKDKGYNILLDIKGKEFTSEEMAKKISEVLVDGNSKINFIIGGSYGVSEKLIKNVDFLLSFSKFTFPHQLMRLVLLEQIYRWFSILNNSKYHK